MREKISPILGRKYIFQRPYFLGPLQFQRGTLMRDVSINHKRGREIEWEQVNERERESEVPRKRPASPGHPDPSFRSRWPLSDWSPSLHRSNKALPAGSAALIMSSMPESPSFLLKGSFFLPYLSGILFFFFVYFFWSWKTQDLEIFSAFTNSQLLVPFKKTSWKEILFKINSNKLLN